MKTFLLCGYRPCDENEAALGLERDASGVTLIDRRIAQLQAMGHEVVCILARNDADELLRECRSIDSCELIFDTNENAANLISNVRSATYGLEEGEACFVLPIEIPVPETSVWTELNREFTTVGPATSAAFLQIPAAPHQSPSSFGFPLLLTNSGATLLKTTPDITSLVDSRLNYQHLTGRQAPINCSSN
jgi:hypothetical protein